MTDFASLREDMVNRQIAGRGITSPLVLRAMREVPREAFVPQSFKELAYEDTPLPIGAGQTISQPYTVAVMTEALDLKGGETVLEIGTGWGYAAAVLARIAARVYTVERIAELARRAAHILEEQGFDNVHVRHGDGTRGWIEHAPYDAIAVTAGGPDVPNSLKQQLTVGGRLVMPVGTAPHLQELVRVKRTGTDSFETEGLGAVRFVPLIGAEGWQDETENRRGPGRAATSGKPAADARAHDAEDADGGRDDRLRRAASPEIVDLKFRR